MTVKITPGLLTSWRRMAENCQPQAWKLDEHGDVVSDHHTVAECGFIDDAVFIATFDPATVLALVAEIERLTSELQEKQRLIDKLCEAEKNRWKSAAAAFGINPEDVGYPNK
jgi:hypothetical protein